CRLSFTTSVFSIKMLSVTSSSSHLGASPVAFKICCTVATKWGCFNWMVEMLTHTLNGGCPASCQSLSCRHAVSSTHLPMCTISPLSSEIGMKLSGGTKPSVGLSQRINASMAAS